MDKRVDIIIPVYNTEAVLLRKAFDSVFEQTYSNISIIVIDDGSTSKQTLDVINEYKQKIKIIRQKNQGVSSARNKGLSISNGDYVFFLDSDDEISPNYIEKLVKTAKEKKADIVFSGKTDPNTGAVDSPITNSWIDLSRDINVISLKNQAFTSSAVLVDGAIARKHQFNTGLAMGEDTVYILEVMKGAESFYEGSGGYYYNKHQNNSSSCRSVKSMMKYLDDSMVMAEILKNEYGASEDTVRIFCNKKISTIFSNGIKHKDIRNAVLCIKNSDIYKNRDRIKNHTIIKEKNLSFKNKIIQLIVNNLGVDILYYLTGARRTEK